jgi:tetratricopeptide (TPR) repeat protein
VEASPHSFKSHQLLAEALYAADDSHSNVDAVLEEAEKGLAILNPLPDSQNMAELYRLAGECYLIKGDRLQSGSSNAGGNSAPAAESFHKALPVLQRGVAILQAARQQEADRLRAEGKPVDMIQPSPNDDLYRLLSAVYVRLGDGDKALDAALEGRKRSPLSPMIYGQLGQVLIAGGQPEDAATALMEGMLVTSDMGLRRQLIDLYSKAAGENACAIVSGPNGPAINPKCGLVHRNLCEASADAIRIRLQTGRPDIAADLKKSSLNDYGCPAGPINEALPDTPGSK